MGTRDDDGDAWRIRADRSIGGRMLHVTTPRSFAILRCAKIKTMGNMGASLQHTFRERDTPNADDRRTPDNTVLVGGDTSRAVLDAWKDRAPEKIRSNAVHGLEYFFGGSPEALKAMSREQQDAYFTDALDWLKARHGAENVLSAVIHRDESTPHMTVMTIPLDERGTLNARAIVGSRQQLSAMQTDFAERVGKTHGLERGLQGSPARHERVQRAYAHLTDPDAAVSLPERRRGAILGLGGETEAEWRERASQAATDALKGVQARWHRDAREHAVEAHVLNQKVTGTPRMQEENDQLRRKLQAYPQLVDDLQGRLEAALKRARQAEATNDRLNTLIQTIAVENCKYAREKGLDEAEMLARTTQAVNRKVEEMEERARRPRPSRKQEPRTLGSEEQVQERRTAPVEDVRSEESPTSENRIKPKDDAWDYGH